MQLFVESQDGKVSLLNNFADEGVLLDVLNHWIR